MWMAFEDQMDFEPGEIRKTEFAGFQLKRAFTRRPWGATRLFGVLQRVIPCWLSGFKENGNGICAVAPKTPSSTLGSESTYLRL